MTPQMRKTSPRENGDEQMLREWASAREEAERNGEKTKQ